MGATEELLHDIAMHKKAALSSSDIEAKLEVQGMEVGRSI